MSEPRISVIAAISKNRVLGKDNQLLWKIPADMKRYVALTTGHPIIMGRKTFESIGRPLPRRTNIVITRDQNYEAPGCVVVSSLEAALAEAKKIESREIFIIGGGQIYAESLRFADRLYLTVVDQEAQGDAFFPDYSEFSKVLNEQSGEHEGLHYKFLDLERGGNE